MSIRHRFLLAMIALSGIGVALSSWLAYRNGEASLQAAVTRQLTGINRSRAYQIESYFQTLQKHVQSLSDDPLFVEAMNGFGAAYGNLGNPPGEADDRSRVEHFYRDVFLPEVETYMGLRKIPSAYLPVGDTAYFLQNRYVVRDAGADQAASKS